MFFTCREADVPENGSWLQDVEQHLLPLRCGLVDDHLSLFENIHVFHLFLRSVEDMVVGILPVVDFLHDFIDLFVRHSGEKFHFLQVPDGRAVHGRNIVAMPLCSARILWLFCAENVSFERFQYNIEILVHKDVIEELAPFLEEIEISLRVLHAVLDVAFGVPPAAAQTVQEL